MQLSDGQIIAPRSTALVQPRPSQLLLCLTSVGPSPCLVISLSTFPLLPCVTAPPSLTRPHGLLFLASSIYHPPRVLVPPRQLPTKERAHCLPTVSPVVLCTPRHSHHALIVRRHHSCHAPLPPSWPPCPSFKPFSYSRWQHERTSTSRGAELARSSSIPRSSY
jgi:hypothetical protein